MAVLLGSGLLEIGLLLGAVAVYFFLHVKKKYRFFEEKGVPYIKPLFLFGSTYEAFMFVKPVSDVYQRFYDEYPTSDVVGLYQGLSPVYLIKNPEFVHKVMVKDFSHFVDRGMVVDEETNPLEGHLFGLRGDKWRFMRNKMSPTFTSGKLKGMYPIMNVCGDLLMKFLKENTAKGDIEMVETLACFTTDVIASCVFGYEPQAMENPNCIMRRMGRDAFRPTKKEIVANFLRFVFPKLFLKLKLKTVRPEMSDFFFGLVKKAFEFRTSTGTKRNDFIQLLLQLREKGEVEVEEDDHDEIETLTEETALTTTFKLTDGILTAQAFVFFLAGFETSATTMTMTLYCLSKHPEIQERLRKEITSVKEKHGKLSYAALKDMKFLDACINETLRLYPPLRVLFRECTKTYTFQETGLTLEKGTLLVIPTYALQTDSTYFPDPFLFNPDRFAEDKTILPGTYLPFGDGPRNCIGRRFALLEGKMGIAQIIESYNVQLSPKQEEPIKINPKSFLAQPLNGLWLRLSPIA